MTLRSVAVLVGLVLAGMVWNAFDARRKQRKIDAAFAGRPSLSPEAFYEAYFRR